MSKHEEHEERVNQLRRELRESPLMDHIREVVAQAPPLSTEQRIRLRAILASPSARD